MLGLSVFKTAITDKSPMFRLMDKQLSSAGNSILSIFYFFPDLFIASTHFQLKSQQAILKASAN